MCLKRWRCFVVRPFRQQMDYAEASFYHDPTDNIGETLDESSRNTRERVPQTPLQSSVAHAISRSFNLHVSPQGHPSLSGVVRRMHQRFCKRQRAT